MSMVNEEKSMWDVKQERAKTGKRPLSGVAGVSVLWA